MAKTIAENSPEERIPKPTSRGKKDGLNYTAIAIMLMFVLPAVVAGVTQLIDFFNPEAAQQRAIRSRVMRCYDVANPGKISEINAILAKYKGKEYKLFASLRNKYPKYQECH